ncbi:LysE family translocator [Hyphomonas johnsonii]|uniref:Lysine exporter protein LysE/YggA n=1 Tax=Hyphomonas johnsonii MHS-2 TaxID=1280950 RepID=A0A059FMF0_9PROT|nr:LysE family translocator [Hyphomonas johnsonii]KCZ91787.1 lysine exporter protein LysE/YggA [Hyphomonas johnsonii MHS-2]
MDLSVWLALLALFFAGGLTPGPAVMLVMSTSLRYNARIALIPAVGISAANLVWMTLAASGIATFAASLPVVLTGLKIAGLLFIAWLAWSMASTDPAQPRASAALAPLRTALFGRGVGLQLLNPNALVFFGLLLPSYFDAARPVIPQAAIIMGTVTMTEMLGLTVYAWAADTMNRRFQNPDFARWFNRFAAAAMLASALFAAFLTTAR